MIKHLTLASAVAVVLGCTSVAIVQTQNKQTKTQAAQVSQTQQLQNELKNSQDTLKSQTATDTQALANAGSQINQLKAAKLTLCNQLKGVKQTNAVCTQ